MAEPASPDAASGEGITMTRVFEVPRERVWREWTEPERFADWFGGEHAEVPVSTVSMDVREGGAWRATMFAGPERREIQWKGEYREVIPPERLVLTITDQPDDDLSDLLIVVLTELGDGRTQMLFEQRGGHMSAKQYEAAKSGWGTFFDRMAAHLDGGN
jgi:uncharacterized protein YndB with AHSA1/START domain